MKISRRISIVGIGFAFIAGARGYQQPLVVSRERILTPELVGHIKDVAHGQDIPGLALVLSQRDGETEYAVWGNRTEQGATMTTDTLFSLASCSKAFLSAAMGILIDDYTHGRNTTPLPTNIHELSWDTKIIHLLPDEWGLVDSWAEAKANVRDILSHVSGLPSHDFSYDRSDSHASLLHKIRHLRPAFELRERYSYNNMMYMIAAHIISKYSGSYTQFVQERIFNPLNMTSTFSVDAATASGRLTQTWTPPGRRIPFWFDENIVELNAGAGGVLASAEDMGKWLQVLLNEGMDPRSNQTLIPSSAFAEITTAHTIISGGHSSIPGFSIRGYGLGWDRYSYAGHDVISHDGSVPGISTFTVFDPLDGIGLSLLANADSKDEALVDIAFHVLCRAWGHACPRHSHDVLAVSTAHNIPSAGPTHNFAGAYYDEAYGYLTLCSEWSTSPECTSLIFLFHTSSSAQSPGTLYAVWPRVWGSHLRLVPVDATHFLFEPVTLFPNGYGKNTTPFEMSGGDIAVAEFVFDEVGRARGFGLSGTVGEPTMREKEGGVVRETADVWFEKVEA
ncbi:beta-lactamase/transpeptidase-like protein [Amylostereum chailletii]|nr:beta-lactamase/transpeptidase-like protein [Amylostereum chailletii]